MFTPMRPYLLIAFVILSSDGVVSGRDAQDDFRKQAPQGWTKLAHCSRNGHERCRLTETHRHRLIRNTILEILKRDGWVVVAESNTPDETRGMSKRAVRGFNNNYGFWLTQQSESPPMCILRSVYTGESGPSRMHDDIRRYYYFALTGGYMLDPDKSLIETFTDDSFRWHDATPIQVGVQSCIKVAYSRTRTFEPLVSGPVHYKGHMIFDPNNSWALIEHYWSCTNPSKGIPRRCVERFTYSDQPIGGIRRIREYWESSRWDDEGSMDDSASTHQIRCEWILTDDRAAAADQFFLTAYALPEPVGVTPPSPRRTWLWLLLSAAVAAVVAAIIRRRNYMRRPI